MFKKLFIAALLCLATQTANAQVLTDNPALNSVIISAVTETGPYRTNFDSLVIWFYKDGFEFPTSDGREYVIVGFSYYREHAAARNVTYMEFIYCYVKSGETYIQHNVNVPFNNPMTGLHVSVPLTFPYSLSGFPNTRYLYNLQDFLDYINNYNAIYPTLPRTIAEYNARYGTAHNALTGLPVLHSDAFFMLDTDKGGVPDWYECLMVHWPGTLLNQATDDYMCVCNPCCSCRCKCTHYNVRQCDGSTDPTTGCACHDGTLPPDPENPDPEQPDNPGISPNALPLLRALLFFVCFCCGAGFFGVFMDSFEKGSF